MNANGWYAKVHLLVDDGDPICKTRPTVYSPLKVTTDASQVTCMKCFLLGVKKPHEKKADLVKP